MYSLKSSTWLRLITHHKSKCIHIKSREIRLHSIWLCGKSHIQRQHSFFLFDRLQEIIESNINIITNTKMLSTSIFSLSIHLNAHLFVYRNVFGCNEGRDYSNSFDFGALSVFCYYFWLNYTPLVALTRTSQHYFFFIFYWPCLRWLAGWLACFVYALSWFILLIFFHLVGSNPKNEALDFSFAYGYGSIIFDCILSTNFTSQVTIVCYTRYISYCRSNNNWDASQPLFSCFISLALLSHCISEHFFSFLITFGFGKFQ